MSHWSSWISDNCRIWGDILRNNCSHSDDRVFSNTKRLAGSTLPDHRAGTNIGARPYMNITVTFHTGRKGDIVPNLAIMLNIRVNIQLKMNPNFDV